MMTAAQFTEAVTHYRKMCGFDSPRPPITETGELAQNFKIVGELLESFPHSATVDERSVRMLAIAASCYRYLQEAKQPTSKGFLPHFLAVKKLSRQINEDLKDGLDPKYRGEAKQRWANLKSVYGPTKGSATPAEGGQRLGEHYWLEVFDPRHRPPHSVNEYEKCFKEWKEMAEGTAPARAEFANNFFTYLDNLRRLTPPYHYLNPEERLNLQRGTYRVLVRGGLLYQGATNDVFKTQGLGWELNNGLKQNETYNDSGGVSMFRDHAIWVMSPNGEFYSGPQWGGATGEMHHSGFLAGAPIGGGGEWYVRNGDLKVISGNSGHYRPTFNQFRHSLVKLSQLGVDLTTVAAEWSFRKEENYYHFRADEVADPAVSANWLDWPLKRGVPLQPVQPLSPNVRKPVPPDVKISTTAKAGMGSVKAKIATFEMGGRVNR